MYMSLRHFERLQSNPSESRLQEILNTNTPVSCLPDSEQLRHALKNCDHTVADLEDDFQNAQQTLDKLKIAIPLAKSYAARIQSIFHPIRSIPDEILIEIFQNCVPHDLPAVQQDSLRPNFPSCILSRVCRRWRAISISAPFLWCVVDLPLDRYYNKIPLGRVLRKLNELLARSASCDISLRVTTSGLSHCPDIQLLLNSALGRTRVLVVELPFKWIKDDFSASYDRLSSLSLTFVHNANVDTPLETFSSAFALTSFTQRLGGPPVKIPLNRLRFYKTSSWPGWDTLRRMELIEGLHIPLPDDSLRNAESDALLSKPLVLEWVSSLSLEESPKTSTIWPTHSCVEYVTQRMRFPKLRQLTLRYQWRPTVEFPTLYYPDVLTHLYISVFNSKCTREDFMDFVASTQNVEYFTLYMMDPPEMAPEILMALAIRGIPYPLIFPRLKRLSLGPSILSSSQCQCTIVQMIATRGIRNHSEGDSDVARCIVMLDTRERLKTFEQVWETFMENVSWKGKTTKCGFGFGDVFAVQARG